MKSLRFILAVLTTMIIFSCGRTEKTPLKLSLKRPKDISEVVVPVDKGFSDYIAGYTSGIVSVNSSVEIRFTPEFATGIKRKNPTGLFIFEPAIKGNAEWTDELTLVFRPAKPLDPGTLYSGKLNLDRLGQVKDNLKTFPIWIQTIRKDFIVITGMLESSREGDSYKLHGQITASDYIASQEVESYLQAKIGRKKDAGGMGSLRYVDSQIHRYRPEQKRQSPETGTLMGRIPGQGKAEGKYHCSDSGAGRFLGKGYNNSSGRKQEHRHSVLRSA